MNLNTISLYEMPSTNVHNGVKGDYSSVDEPQLLTGFTVSFLTLPPILQVIGEDDSQIYFECHCFERMRT